MLIEGRPNGELDQAHDASHDRAGNEGHPQTVHSGLGMIRLATGQWSRRSGANQDREEPRCGLCAMT